MKGSGRARKEGEAAWPAPEAGEGGEKNREVLVHPFPPLYNPQSRILILGSFPSVKSREMAFFYGHPQNRFWRVMAALFQEEFPQTVEERAAFLHRNHVACWDVIHSCKIVGSSDTSIREVTVNDIKEILRAAPIERIFVNGKTAQRMYERYTREQTGREAIYLPSTSPANAAWSLERLISAWKVIL